MAGLKPSMKARNYLARRLGERQGREEHAKGVRLSTYMVHKRLHKGEMIPVFKRAGMNRAFDAGALRTRRNEALEDVMHLYPKAVNRAIDRASTTADKFVRPLGSTQLTPIRAITPKVVSEAEGPEAARLAHLVDVGGAMEKIGPGRRRLLRDIFKMLKARGV